MLHLQVIVLTLNWSSGIFFSWSHRVCATADRHSTQREVWRRGSSWPQWMRVCKHH